MRKQFCQLVIVLGILMKLTACSNTSSWDEEVKLLDGRIITVQQKRRFDDSRMPREAWLSFKLQEFGNKEILWHEALATMVLNVHQGKLYVVGIPHGILEYRQYGSPEPYYIGFRYDNGQFVRIPFNEIPEAIYDANMWFENMVNFKIKHLSINEKTPDYFGTKGICPIKERSIPNTSAT
jgi:hypothetical protein